MKIIAKIKSLYTYFGFVAHETNPVPFWVLFLFVVLLSLLMIPIGHIISFGYNPLLAEYSDFASIKIYIATLPSIIFILYCIKRVGVKHYFTPLTLSLIITFTLICLYQYVILPEEFRLKLASTALYLICSGLLGYAVYKLQIWPKYKELVCWTLILNGVVQSIIAIIQFSLQHSIGLNLLGESPLSINQYGVAKIILETTTFIRSYGTNPHPNILSAFLFIISILNLYLLNNTTQRSKRIVLYFSFILNIIGLTLTFSRGGLLAFVLGIFLALASTALHKGIKFTINKLYFLIMALIVPLILFFPWLAQRSNINDSAVSERSAYFEVGKNIVLNNWYIGTGAGTNLFHMKLFLEDKLEPWNIQPVHNYFLISWSELGIISLIPIFLILYFLYRILRKSLSNLYRKSDIFKETSLFFTIFCGVFVLFWLDHYFYTYWPVQAFLWMLLGMSYSSLNYEEEDWSRR